mgnify:FL=1
MRDEMTDKNKTDIEKWLAKGNKITICPPGARTEDLVYTWGPKKKAKAKAKK